MTVMDQFSFNGQQRWIPCFNADSQDIPPCSIVSCQFSNERLRVGRHRKWGSSWTNGLSSGIPSVVGVSGFTTIKAGKIGQVTFDFPAVVAVSTVGETLSPFFAPRVADTVGNASYWLHEDEGGDFVLNGPLSSGYIPRGTDAGLDQQFAIGPGAKLAYVNRRLAPGRVALGGGSDTTLTTTSHNINVSTTPSGGLKPASATEVRAKAGGTFDLTLTATIKRVTVGSAGVMDIGVGITSIVNTNQFPAVSSATTQYMTMSVRRLVQLAYNEQVTFVAGILSGTGGTITVVGTSVLIHGTKINHTGE